MPDTYTSQFSGEEIDAALRAAQIISGASTPAELRKKLEIRGDTIPVSATDPTPVSEALTASGGGVNPNLLDNWYFGRPVNQRGGYIIPAGVEYNDLSWNHAGTTDKAYPVVGYGGQDPLITVNGTNYIVGKSAQVPGYCAAGYTIDRWKLDIGEAVTLEDGCICLKKSGTYWGEYFADFDQFIGMTLTGSVLLSDGTLRTGSFVYNGSLNQGQTFFSSELGFYVQRLSDSLTQCEINSLVDNVKIKAAKLELGSTQTLAHKEGDKWVLNEIPDFGEQLRRCQWYCRVYKAGTTLPCLAYPQPDGGWYASVGIPTNGMRTIPTNNLGDGKKVAIIDLDGTDATHDDMSMMNWGSNEYMLRLRISGGSHGVLTSKFPYWIKLKEDLILSADL